MRRVGLSLALVGLLAAGCAEQKSGPAMSSPMPKGSGPTTAGPDTSEESTAGDSGVEVPAAKEGAEESEVVASTTGSGEFPISQENTRITFIGTHTPEKPDPRIGGFEKFSGKAEYDPATKTLKSVSIDIDAGSIWTKFPPLTAHLKNADFFDVKEIPTAAFKSTAVEVVNKDEGTCNITGDLTLHGVTKSITIPASVAIGESSLMIKSDFKIDRTEFDMNFSTDKVDKEVAISVFVGEKTDPANTHLP
jgi:polyisoprenoid-binding protein YceI